MILHRTPDNCIQSSQSRTYPNIRQLIKRYLIKRYHINTLILGRDKNIDEELLQILRTS